AMRGLERGPAAERQGRLDGDAVERHREVGTRKSVAMNVAGDGGASSDRFVDLLPIDLLGIGGGGRCRQCANRKYLNNTKHQVLLFEPIAGWRPQSLDRLPFEQAVGPHCSSE